ncbi:hypothetical protein C8R42DRAFT_643035 [Lentinula raphanica]|nr:hypothetical protein C8R42DRAFT_643035 [Lentinula raphanica]
MAQILLGSSSPCHLMQSELSASNHTSIDDAAIIHKRSPIILATLYETRKLRSISPADGRGFLYAYLDDGVDWKVGMSNNFARRRREWDRQCPCPTRIWMEPLPVAKRRRAESLAHLLIEGICTDRPRKHCAKCRRHHQEIFSFRVADNSVDTLAVWEDLVYPLLVRAANDPPEHVSLRWDSGRGSSASTKVRLAYLLLPAVAYGKESQLRGESMYEADHLEDLKVSTKYDNMDEAELKRLERRAVRRLDFAILPMMTMFYILSFLDRANIGNARVAGLQKDLGIPSFEKPSSSVHTVFIRRYICAELPANLLLRNIGPRFLMPTLLTLWGLMVALQDKSRHSYAGLATVRAFLGLVEGPMFPGIVLYLSSFYTRSELAFR